jgi:hypothetical protein
MLASHARQVAEKSAAAACELIPIGTTGRGALVRTGARLLVGFAAAGGGAARIIGGGRSLGATRLNVIS